MPAESKTNLAARAGRWSAQNRKKAIFGWFAFVLIAVVVGNIVGTKPLRNDGTGESGRADQITQDAFPDKAAEQVLIQGRTGSINVRDPQFKAAVADVAQRLSHTKGVSNVQSPYISGNSGQISKDGRSVAVNFDLRGDDDATAKTVDNALATTAAAQRAHPQLRVEEFGDASADKAIGKAFNDDFAKAEKFSLPITIGILIVAFGALMAAGIPVLLAMSAVFATLGITAVISQLMPMEDSVQQVVLMIGLAVGVDYSLFYIRRERQERAAGKSAEAALEAAAATSGRAVLVSAVTVMLAMAGMYVAGDATFSGMATGTIVVVASALVASLTVLPALLSKLGDRVEKGRIGIPFLSKRRRSRSSRGTESRVWSAILDRVLARPKLAAGASAGLLVALAIPALGLHTQLPGNDTLPRTIPAVKTYDRLEAAFPGGAVAANVVVKGDDVTKPAYAGPIAKMERAALATGKLHGPITTDISPDKTVASIGIPVDGDGTSAASNASLSALRGEVMPAFRADLPSGSEAKVGGQTAGTTDFNDLMKSRLPWVFAFVLSMAFALLLVTFRSIVIPVKAIALNLLSVAAAYGVLVTIFQHGVGKSLIGFDHTGPITSWLPLFLFVVLFGLSMDYHVFVLTRVREAFDNGMSTEDAVAHGIKSTASTVTSAAVIMVAVFGIFATLSMVEMKQMGVGLAAAILIDATVVRAILLPATMKLLGDWNWYLPRKLRWLPKVEHERSVEPARA